MKKTISVLLIVLLSSISLFGQTGKVKTTFVATKTEEDMDNFYKYIVQGDEVATKKYFTYLLLENKGIVFEEKQIVYVKYHSLGYYKIRAKGEIQEYFFPTDFIQLIK